MDHLPYPSNASLDPLEIPFVCEREPYNFSLSFDKYPLRKGWSVQSCPHGWTNCSFQELAVRTQTWLYFGTLSEFFGQEIPSVWFLASPGTEKLSSRILPRLLRSRKKHYRPDFFTPASSKATSHVAENPDKSALCLKTATLHCEIVEQQLRNKAILGASTEFSTLSLIICSIKVLLQSLGYAKYPYFRERRWRFRESSLDVPRFPWVVSACPIIIQRMIQSGWCPAEIHLLSIKYSCIALYYLSALPRDRRKFKNHSECSFLACKAYHLDPLNYPLLHAPDASCSSCSEVGAEPEDVASIIHEEDGIPLVSCSLRESGEIDFKVIRKAVRAKYYAISHVWSDGRGNPRGNKINVCQVISIYKHLKRLCKSSAVEFQFPWVTKSSEILFWIDTICIPRGESEYLRSARWKAIDRIAIVFSGAEATLVLDNELLQTSSEGLSQEQILAHVLSSSWMTRCWTLQEASLAQLWCIQFEDRAIRISNFCTPITRWLPRAVSEEKYLSQTMTSGLWEEILTFLTEMESTGWQRRGRDSMWVSHGYEYLQGYSFALTWNTFTGRYTSIAADKHLILARMQDFRSYDMRKVREDIDDRDVTRETIKASERMKAILKGHLTLPIDVLFCSGPRVLDSDECNRWAPLAPQYYSLDITLGYLEVYLDRLWIRPRTTENLTICRLEQPVSDNQDFFLINLFTADGSKTVFRCEPCNMEQSCITTEATYILFPSIKMLGRRATWFRTRGALFTLDRLDTKAMHLTYLCPLEIYLAESLGQTSLCTKDTTLNQSATVSAQQEVLDKGISIKCGKSRAASSVVLPFGKTLDD